MVLLSYCCMFEKSVADRYTGGYISARIIGWEKQHVHARGSKKTRNIYSLELLQRAELNVTDRAVVRVKAGNLLAAAHIPDLQKSVLGAERGERREGRFHEAAGHTHKKQHDNQRPVCTI